MSTPVAGATVNVTAVTVTVKPVVVLTPFTQTEMLLVSMEGVKPEGKVKTVVTPLPTQAWMVGRPAVIMRNICASVQPSAAGVNAAPKILTLEGRSEERRVGKECRSRWS